MSDVQNPTSVQGNLARSAAVIGVGMAAAMLVPNRADALSLTYAGSIPGTGDVKVLNYALALEEFEAALYQASLAQLSVLGVAAGNKVFDLLTEFAIVEQDHATFLRSALTQTSGPVISKFTYDFSKVTSATSARDILELVLQVEATGVRAYLGAVPLLSVGSKYLQIAAAIQGTEARHTSVLTIARNQLYATGSNVAPLNPDNNVSGTFTSNSFKYETYSPSGYNALKPNEGVIGIDANLQPDTVLAAVGPFFAAPISS